MALRAWVGVLAMVLATTGGAMAAPNVVVTIKPLHSLVAAVMAGVGEPALLVEGGASAHTYSLRPSDAAALQKADIVFWAGPDLELFLADSIATLAPGAKGVALVETTGLALLPLREGGAFDGDGEGHGHDGHDEAHDQGGVDMHFWLDPDNAIVLVQRIAAELIGADPANVGPYASNAETTVAALRALKAEISVTLAPVRATPVVVFHDAYQYFEQRFGLTVVGTVTVSPEALPGAQRIGALRQRLATLGPACIFAEPQFEPAVVATIAAETGARIGVLDPEGAGLEPGPGLYADVLRGLAAALAACAAAP